MIADNKEFSPQLKGVTEPIKSLDRGNELQLLQLHVSVLNLIASDQPLKAILTTLALGYQQAFQNCRCLIRIVDPALPDLWVAPGLADDFCQALFQLSDNPLAVNSTGGTEPCEPEIMVSLSADPRRPHFSQLATHYGIQACWSFPVLNSAGRRCAQLVLLDDCDQSPSEVEGHWIETLTQLLAQAVARAIERRALQHNEQRFRSLFFSNPDATFALDSKGCFTAINRAGCFLWQGAEQELIGQSFIEQLPEDNQAKAQHHFTRAMHGSPQSFELQLPRNQDDSRMLHLTYTPIHIDRHIVGIFVIAQDLTEKFNSQENLRLFERAINASSNGVIIADARQPDQPIVFVNKSFERITGYQAAEVLGRNCRFLQEPQRDDAAAQEIRVSLQQQKECQVLIRNARKDGTLFWNQLYIAPVPDDQGQISHFIGVQTDVTEQKSYEAELAFNASHDILTGLPNRALLQDRLNQACRMSARSKRSLGVLFIDLDGFKLVNDSLGHQAGDQLLIEVGQRLSTFIRPGDTLARLGGDEFVLLVPELTHEEDLICIAERALQLLNQGFEIDGQELNISASIGITVSTGALDEPAMLIQQADLAMFKAKQLGHNTYQWYQDELNQELGRQLTMRSALQKALVANELSLHFQPQYDAISQRMTGLEALLRWTHPKLGAVPPSDFIPIAEESGQIIAMSEWVLDQACCLAARLRQKGHQDLVMAVNVSSLQFQRSNFIDVVRDVLQKYQLAPEALELELTESVLLVHTEQAIHKLRQLNQLGVSIAIDDFGTGFSSLSYLKHLPLQKIKIDQSFVRDVIRDRHDAAITKAIIALAHHMQIKVIAEGVETKAQVAFLRKHGCDEFQGYYFSKPMPEAQLLQLLADNQSLQQQADDEGADATEERALLLLDDEENILNALARLLRREPYRVYTATNAEQAFELLALHDIQVIISDQRMPQMSGTEFLSKVKTMYPQTVRLVLSGYTDLKSVTAAVNEGSIYRFLTKPWDDKQLKEEIRLAFLHQQKDDSPMAESSS